jgi:outer membrane protein assembly factor BamB
MPAPPQQDAGPLPLPSPGQIFAQLHGAKQVSSLLSRDASDFVPGFSHRVSTMEPDVILSPAWENGYSAFETIAWAIYRFDLTARTGRLEIHTQWPQPPGDYTRLWLGASDWQKNRWHWYSGAPAGVVQTVAGAIDAFKHPETGEMYVAVVLLGQTSALLRKVWLTCSLRGDWWMDGREAGHRACSPFIGPDSPAVKWQVRLGYISNSCPAVYDANGIIYIGAGNGGTGMYSTLYALNPDGTQKWLLQLPTDLVTGYSPAIGDDGTIYYAIPDASLHAVGQDGKEVWSFSGSGCIISSPALGKDGSIYVVGGEQINAPHYLHALDAHGSQLWEHYFADGPPLGAGPAVGADGTLYVGGGDHKLYAFDPNGSVLWTFETPAGVTTVPFVDRNGRIYFANAEPKLYVVDPDGSLAWSVQLGNIIWRQPMAIGPDGSIYVCVGDDVYSYDSAGALRWTYYVAGVGHLSVDANGTVYVGSDNTRLYALNADGTLKWWFVASSAIDSTPAIGEDGTIYMIDSDGVFYAIGPGSQEPEYTVSGYVKDEHGASMPGVEITITGEEPVFTDAGGSWSKSGLTDGTYLVSPSKEGYQFAPPFDSVTLSGADAGMADFNGSPLAPPVWPMWGGNRAHTHCSPFSGPPEATMKWSLWLEGATFTTEPAIGGDGAVYMESAYGTTYALNPDGTIRWQYATGFTSAASPAIALDGTVYTNNTSAESLRRILALTPGGVFKWSYATDAGAYDTPVLSADGLIIHPTRGGLDTLALNPDGTVNWISHFGNTSYTAIADDRTIYVINSDSFSTYYQRFIALNPDGSFKWASKQYDQPLHSPVAGIDGTVYCMTWSRLAGNMLVALNTDGTEKWTCDLDAGPSGPAISADGTIYFTQGEATVVESHKLIALNPDGTLKWEYYAGGYIFMPSLTVDADGTAYVGIRNTYSVYAISADGTLKWTFDDPHGDIGPISIGTDGTLYFGDGTGTVYAVGPGGG